MSEPVQRGELWRIPTIGGRTRDVIVISVPGVAAAHGTVVAVVCYDSGTFSASLVAVAITEPLPCLAVAIDVANFRLQRFTDGGKRLGTVPPDTMERLDSALRSVLGL